MYSTSPLSACESGSGAAERARAGTRRCVHFAERGDEAQDAPLEVLARFLDIDHRVRAQPARKQKTPAAGKENAHVGDFADVRLGSWP